LKQLVIIGLQTIPEIQPGDNIADIILGSCSKERVNLSAGDIILVTSKIVSKAENRLVDVSKVVPSKRARAISRLTGKSPVEVEIILGETKEIEAVIPIRRIVEKYPFIIQNLSQGETGAAKAAAEVPSMLVTLTKQGILATDAGLDYSNNPMGKGSLLPSNPNESARNIRSDLLKKTGKEVAVVLTDSEIAFTNIYGSTEVAIGYSGITPTARLFGAQDRFGRAKFGGADVTVDELACAAGLLSGQTSEGIPVVIVKGLQYEKEDVNLTSFPNEALKKGILWTFYSTLKLRLFGRLYELFL
jgi:coenzyme F420-0:L-glutamate ligase / coenzyme F420-1:gamma-L-glutamate ligase